MAFVSTSLLSCEVLVRSSVIFPTVSSVPFNLRSVSVVSVSSVSSVWWIVLLDVAFVVVSLVYC